MNNKDAVQLTGDDIIWLLAEYYSVSADEMSIALQNLLNGGK